MTATVSGDFQTRRGTLAAWAAANPILPAGAFGWESDTNKLKIGDGVTAWNSLSYFTPSGGSAAGAEIARASASRTAGDLTFNTTGWQNVDTGIDLTLTGVAAGDKIDYMPNLLVDSTGANAFALNVATIVSAAVVNTFGPNGASDNGVAGWYSPSAAFNGVCGSASYTLVSGDISGGNVLLRLRVRPANTTARKILASTTTPLKVVARAVR